MKLLQTKEPTNYSFWLLRTSIVFSLKVVHVYLNMCRSFNVYIN